MAKSKNTADVGFEEKLWQMADKMRNNMSPSEYKHVVLGLIFLKYISDRFMKKYAYLEENDPDFVEDKDFYEEDNILWVPKKARWDYIKDNAKNIEIGQIVDEALIEIEKENSKLKGVLDKRYAKPELDKTRLGELIDVISTIELVAKQEGVEKDIIGRVYEYFLAKFADAEGKGGGEFYTPSSVVRTLVELIEPYKGRIYDPCCGSGGMFVQSEKFVKQHSGNVKDISIYGQESNHTTWRLCQMNLAIRGIECNLGNKMADSFSNDLHKTLKADYVLANPPFNISDWGGDKLTEDPRWVYGIPPAGNANYAWLQHILYHLKPGGEAGIVLANGSLSTTTSGEGDIRQSMIEANTVKCIVAMPTQLFYSTGIPVSLWILRKPETISESNDQRENEILFIDAREMGEMVTRRHRELSDEDINKISSAYINWKNKNEDYEDIAGFCKSASLDEVKEHDYILTPGRYVGIEDEEDDGIPFEEKMEELTSELGEQFAESAILEKKIRENLGSLGFEIEE